MSNCNPTHPNCLEQKPVSGVRFCAGCGRSAADISIQVSANTASTSTDGTDPWLVQDLDVVSDDDFGSVNSDGANDTAVQLDEIDDVVFADASADVGEPVVVVVGDADDSLVTGFVPPSPVGGTTNLNTSVATQASPSLSLQAALTQLEGWATKWDCRQDPYVAGLTQAISQRDDLTMWASLSSRDHLPRPSSASRFEVLSLVGRMLTLVRNVLVFVPVAITWYAIGKATEAYGQFTDDFKGTELNFLQFWQAGEHGGKQYLSSFWHIGDVARFDALLIALIVILTLVVGAIGAQSDRSERKFDEEVESERLELSFVLANALHGRRSASPESIGESLAEALNDLTQAARDVNDVASRLERATVGVDTLGPKLDVLNQHTDRLVGQSVQSITTSMSALVSSVSQLNSAVSTNVTQVFADATANLEEVSAQFSRIAASMEVGAAQLREDLEHINRQLGTGNRGSK